MRVHGRRGSILKRRRLRSCGAGWTLARLRQRHAGQLSMRQPGVGKQVGVSRTPGGLLVSAVLPRRILICPSDWLCGTAFLPLTLA